MSESPPSAQANVGAPPREALSTIDTRHGKVEADLLTVGAHDEAFETIHANVGL